MTNNTCIRGVNVISYYEATLSSRDRLAHSSNIRDTGTPEQLETFRRWAHECTEVQSAFEMHQREQLAVYRKPLEIYRWLVYR